MVPGFLGILKLRSALGELRCATGCFQTVLLSLLHSGVTGQETSGLQSSAEFRIDLKQGAGNAVTDCAGLTGNAAACNGADDVNGTQSLGSNQRLTNDQLQGVQTEILVNVTAIDGDGTSAALIQANTSNGGLTSAGAVLILSFALVH